MAETTLAEVMAELAELENPKMGEVNEKHGDDHGVNLGKLRALAVGRFALTRVRPCLRSRVGLSGWPGLLGRIQDLI